ncbi:MAG: chemotaxis protein CheC [Sporolactobacillus sp.]
MRKLSELGPADLDFLKEVGNIGIGHAADALSQLINKRIDMQIPFVKIIALKDIMTEDREKAVSASYIGIEGDIQAYFFMMFENQFSQRLIRRLLPAGSDLDTDMAESAFCEIGNILCGSYIGALASFLELHISQTPPVYAADMEAAILAEGLAELSLYDDAVILIEAVLFDRSTNESLQGEFYFLPAPESLDTIFRMTEGKSFS